jgi:hypothetical protein
VRFVPYWRKGNGIESETPGVIISAHVRPSSTVLWVINTNRQDSVARIHLDAAKLELHPEAPVEAYDAENGEHYSFADGRLTVAVSKRMWRAIRLIQLH